MRLTLDDVISRLTKLRVNPQGMDDVIHCLTELAEQAITASRELQESRDFQTMIDAGQVKPCPVCGEYSKEGVCLAHKNNI
jgi:hypothetical protein